MKVVGGSALSFQIISNLADDFALADGVAIDHFVAIQLLRRHVQVTEAEAFARRIHHNMEGRLTRRPQHHAVTHGHDVMLIGLATAGPDAALLARTRANVLTLVAETRRACADKKVAMLAKIIAPGVGVVAAAALILDQGDVVDAAAVGGRVALPPHAYAA